MKKILSIVLAVLMLASMVAISGVVSAAAEDTTPVTSVELIPAYGNKDLSIVSNTMVAGDGVNEFSIVDTSTLTGGAEGVPSATAYYLKNNAKVNKIGMYFEVNKEIWPVTREWANKELYLEFWIWTSAKLANPVLRMFPVKENNGGSYVEYACQAFGDNSKWTTTAGWSRAIIKLDSGYSNNNAGGKWYYEMMNEGIFRNFEVHDHGNAGADIAVAAARLIVADSTDEAAQAPWGIEISSKRSHYYIGETASKSDFTVKYQGQEVTDYTMSEIDTSVYGRKIVTFTVNGVTQTYRIQVKPRGNTFGDTNAELYGGKPDNGIGCQLNADNFRTGDQSMVFFASNDTHYRTYNETPIDLTGEEYFEFWIYITSDFLKTASTNSEFLIELSSKRNPTANTWRYHWVTNNSNYNLLQFNQGWQKVRIPLQKDLSKGGDFDRTTNHIDGKVNLVQNFSEPMDFSEVDGMRIRTPNWPSDISSNGLILLGGIGYGMDVSVNGEKWGDDLATAIAEAPAGATVKLENDITTDETIIIDKKVYLDLNRFTLRSSADPIFKIVEGGNLRVVDNNNYLRLSYGGVQKFQGDIISTTANASAFKMIGSTDNDGSSTILKVSEKIDIFADYGVDINLDTKAEGIYTSYGVKADLYGNFAPSGLSENNNCNVYINGLVQGDPIVNIYGGTYKVTDVSHFAVPGEGTINVMGGTFDGDLLAAGTTTTAEVKTDVYLFDNYTDKVDGLILAGGTWDIDVSSAKDIQGGAFLNETYKEVVDVELNTVDSNDADLLFAGNWTTFNNQKNANNYNMIRASKSGSTIQFNFTGSVLELAGYKAPSYGKVQIEVIGKGSYIVDLYAEAATWDAHLFTSFVGEGTHDVVITVLDEKNEAATNKGLFYAALDTISVDGTVNALDENYVVETDVILDSSSAVITVDEVKTNNATATGLTNVVAENGFIAVEDNKIHYVAEMTTSDTITYKMNGVKGQINVSFEDGIIFEAEDYLDAGTTANAWKLSNHSAITLKNGESAEFTFTGSAITIIGYKSLKYGDFRLFIDDQYIERVSETAEGYNYQFALGKWTCDENTTHTVKVVAMGNVLLDGFIIQ
ncbi:MAG: hypothetical protein IJ462_03255 [Clostridia bacterium]|nr:hypothetical protein [Clostridia bacterium]